MQIKLPRRPASAVKRRSVEIASWPKSGNENGNDGTVASVAVGGTTGAVGDGVAIDPLTIAEDLDAAPVEAGLPGEIAIHIMGIVIAMCPKGVAVAGKTSGEDVPPPDRYL